ncbi:hypothetical protein [Clostridium oryzae]|uniref:Uncharacterized protein n=1 Tax=Clostridium oryzae TaxID=1450648 RepID=A0A1V4IST2_9CLOT|nr:hypothetical protein [Clostridium oryzae]OPJ62864.1 hypothetical protein CLORY_14880 [Clostridium oryzae]
MKSSNEQLKSRGYVTDEDVAHYVDFSKSELLELLNIRNEAVRSFALINKNLSQQ